VSKSDPRFFSGREVILVDLTTFLGCLLREERSHYRLYLARRLMMRTVAVTANNKTTATA
jgi:hypothetical protein